MAAQLDDFACPDEFLGFYPHLISCDKYWACQDGVQELRTCGNGLAFIDTDEGMRVSYDIWTVLSWLLLRVTSHRHHITSRQQLSRPCIKQSALLLCSIDWLLMVTLADYKLEQCAELHLVECGERTELEPPISTPNCPRLFGTFADTQDCGVFWNCQDGKANRYNCPPGLAYDEVRSKYSCEIVMKRLSDLNLFTENFPGGRCRMGASG